MKPKLLAADIQMVEHNGRQGFLLKERIGLADHVVIVPQALGTLLALLDGQRDVGAIRAAFTLRTGMVLPPSLLDELLSELDAAYLLDSPRFRAALAELRDEYRAAPSRPMALAGGCYPAGVDELQKAMDDYCRPYRDAPVLPKDLAAERIRGLVTPHIDYARGHDTYAQVWLGAEQAVRGAELAIILGTDHMGTEPILTPTVQSYATPWGILPTDRQIAEEVAEAEGAEAAFADEIHHLQEHSIELAAVWLHYVRRGEPLPMVPLLCGSFESLLEDGQAPRALDPEPLPRRAHPAAVGDDREGRREAQVRAAGPGHGIGPVDDSPGQQKPVPADRFRHRVPGPGQADRSRDPRPAGGFQADDQDVVDGGGEGLAPDGDRLGCLGGDAGDAVADIEPALVARPGPDIIEVDEEIAEGLVGPDPRRPAQHVLLRQGRGFGVAPFEEGPADKGQALERPGIVVVDGSARPDRLLVELELFAVRGAEDHGPEPPVADGQGLVPVGGRLPVPEPVPAGDSRPAGRNGPVGGAGPETQYGGQEKGRRYGRDGPAAGGTPRPSATQKNRDGAHGALIARGPGNCQSAGR